MIRLTVVFLGFTLMVGLATVGTSQEKEKKAKGMLPAGWKDLGLTPEQKLKVYSVQADYKPKIVKLQDEIKSLQAQEKAELVKILTPDQKAKLAKGLIGETKKEELKKAEKKEP